MQQQRDCHSVTYRSKDMKAFLSERRIDQVMILGEITGYLQSLDIAINKPFKDHLCTDFNNYIEHPMEINQRVGQELLGEDHRRQCQECSKSRISGQECTI